MLPFVFGLALLCFVAERLFPGWPLPKIKTWPIRVILVNLVQLSVILLAGVSWEKWLSSKSLFHLGSYASPTTGGLIAYFIATFVFYWWHRWRHRIDALWLMFHQVHHSPQRIEVITSFYKHPLEMVVNSLIGSVLVYSCLGLSLRGCNLYPLHRGGRVLLSHQHQDAAMGWIRLSAARNAPNPP
jgi:sterol desaturase/sphingolipid hydroxylase (fatty acid hydroxylase superfamily)